MVIFTYFDDFAMGVWTTLYVAFLSFGGGLVLGVLGATARRSKTRILRAAASTYVELVRNIPCMVLLYFVFFGLPAAKVYPPAAIAGIIALALNSGAYLTEVIRAGLESVPIGQLEAARTLGLSRSDTFFRVTLPQAVRAVYPPVVTDFLQINLLGSSVVSVIAVQEITATALIVNGITFKTIETFTTALILYLILANVVSFGANVLGRRIFKAPLGGDGSQLRKAAAIRSLAVEGVG